MGSVADDVGYRQALQMDVVIHRVPNVLLRNGENKIPGEFDGQPEHDTIF